MTYKKGAGATTTPDATNTYTSALTVPQRREFATARTHAAPPCTGRGLWLAVVLTCPHCSTAHSHRVGEAARLLTGRVVRMCPVVGQPYRLAPVTRRRTAVRVVR